MYIEKLGLAFHLKCFRCSVCNQTLGNGKEGTDVRVSGQNRLHCNNCFSNDLGNIIVSNNMNSRNKSSSGFLNEGEFENYKKNNLNELYSNLNGASGDYLTFKKYAQMKSKMFDDYLVLPNHLKSRTGVGNYLVKTKRH
jgi:hypothetical protein